MRHFMTQLTMITTITAIIFLATGCAPAAEQQIDNRTLLSGLLLEQDLTGTVVKGPLRAATVTVYALGEEGNRSSMKEETVTDSAGRFRFRNRYRHQRIEIVAKGGEYTDEATGEIIRLNQQTELCLQLAATDDAGDVTVSPLTTMAAERTRTRLRLAAEDADGAIIRSRLEIAAMFGLVDFDPGPISVDDLTDIGARAERTRLQTRYGLVLSGLSQLLLDEGVDPDQLPALIDCYARDASDGSIDGADTEGPLGCSAPLGSVQAHAGMEQAMNNFMNNIRNQHREKLQGMSVPVPVTSP